MKRDSMLLYETQFEALCALPAEQFKAAMIAIAKYSLYGTEPDGSDPIAYAMWMMSKPLTDKRNKNYENSKQEKKKNNQTESEPEANDKRTASEPEANVKRTGSEVEANVERTVSEPEANPDLKEKGKRLNVKGETLKEKPSVLEKKNQAKRKTLTVEEMEAAVDDRCFGEEIKDALIDWVHYKSERREAYTETGMKNTLSQIESYVSKHGERTVANRIRDSMSNNWVGMNLDKMAPTTRGASYSDKILHRNEDVDSW